MVRVEHQFVVEVLRRHSGVVLGCVHVPMDWVPAQETLALEMLRRGIGGSAAEMVGIEPEWEAPGRPRIRGFSATLLAAGEPAVSRRFPLSYFADQARIAAEHFVETGALKAGDLFEYSVLAVPQERTPVAARRFVVENSEAAVPVKAADLKTMMGSALALGTSDGEEMPAFVQWRVLEQISALTRRAGAMETGGVLVGHVCRDEGKVFVEITAQVPTPAQGELTRLAFTPAVWSSVRAATNARGAGEIWCGWWHSHSWWHAPIAQQQQAIDETTRVANAAAQPFFSEDDRQVHRTVFPRAYSVALLVTDSPHGGMSWSAFGWQLGRIVARGFHAVGVPLSEFVLPTGVDHAENGQYVCAH